MKPKSNPIIIAKVEPTPFVTKDGFQETLLTLKLRTAFSGWYRVTLGDMQPYTFPLGELKRGKRRVKILLRDTHDLLRPGETTRLRIELFRNKAYRGDPEAVYTTDCWGRTRHWEFYLSQTMHTDLGYTDYQEDLRTLFSRFLDTVKEYMKNSDRRDSDLQKYKYAIESGWVLGAGYMTQRNADQIQEIVDLIERGRMTVGAGRFNYTMECFSTEEAARAAYYTNRYLVDRLGIPPSTTQRMFDNPAFSKSYVDVAASAGIRYGIHSMNPDRSPYHEKKLYDLFYMQGMNPHNRLLIFNGKTYGENYGFGGDHWNPDNGSAELVQKNLLNLIAELEVRTGRRSYPYDKFPLPLIPYGDNKQPLEKQVVTANEVNRRWTDAGYVYPRITTAFPETFFEQVEREYKDLIPVEHGTEENWWNDGWGTTAFESGINKQAGVTVPMAETAAGLSSLLYGRKYPRDDLMEAVERNLTYDEHTWGYHSYTGDEMYHRQFEWKRSNAFGAKALGEKVLNRSLKSLAAQVKTESSAIFVYNPMNWERNDVVRLANDPTLPRHFEITDGETPIPYALDGDQIVFAARGVPALGYKVFSIRETDRPAQFEADFHSGPDFIENAFYKVTFYPDGTIQSIRDKQSGSREVVEPAQKFNQYQYFDDFGIPFSNMGAKFSKHKWAMYTPQAEQARLQIEQNAVSITAVLNTGTFRAGGIRQRVTLYRDIPRIEIVNEVVKSPLPSLKSKEEAFYVFPFAAGKDYTIRYDLPIGNTTEGEQVYGTSTDWYTANKWVNVHDQADDYSMTLAIPNTALLQFGERRTGNWSFDYQSRRARIYSYIFNNMWQTNFQGDQPGYACFKYALTTGHGEDIGRINRFAWEYSAPLQAAVISGPQDGDGCAVGQYLAVSHQNLILTTLKAAEANGDGMILRLCETAGQAVAGVRVTLPPAVVSYNETDVIENDVEPPQSGNIITFDIPAYGMKTFRIRTDQTLPKVRDCRAVSCSGKISGTQVSWDGVENALYYEVFRTRDSASPLFLATTDKTELFDAQVPEQLGDRYKYLVRACGSGTKGAFSDEILPIGGEFQGTSSPERPILGAVAREKQRIDLYWTPMQGCTCYRIYRDGQKIGETTDSYVCTYRDRTVSFGKVYQYTVSAVDRLGNERASDPVQIAHNAEVLVNSDGKTARKSKGIFRYF